MTDKRTETIYQFLSNGADGAIATHSKPKDKLGELLAEFDKTMASFCRSSANGLILLKEIRDEIEKREIARHDNQT